MSVHGRLLVVNYALDSKDALLSHQLEAVAALAKNFNSVTVITGRVGSYDPITNVKVVNTNWEPGKRFLSISRLLFKSLPIIVHGKFESVFFHMTDLQCAVLSPFFRIRGKKQIFWYAHTKKSFFMWWSSKWVNSIVTSTQGSCPLQGRKVITIGQAIDENRFTEIPLEKLNLSKLIHIGRFDKSKNIELLIEQATALRSEFKEISLTLVGSPANQESRIWAEKLIHSHRDEVEKGWLKFSESIARSEVPSTIAKHGCFFHSYLGSLDKTLIESTMMRVPVISTNPEYTAIFGTWSLKVRPNLADEYRSLMKLSKDEIDEKLKERRLIATKSHSLGNWTKQLSHLLA
jgi:glycosyltransferase involved in cell wall biosynthesis